MGPWRPESGLKRGLGLLGFILTAQKSERGDQTPLGQLVRLAQLIAWLTDTVEWIKWVA